MLNIRRGNRLVNIGFGKERVLMEKVGGIFKLLSHFDRQNGEI